MEYNFNNICTLREPCHTVAQNLHNLFLSPKAYLNGSTLLLPVTELLFLSSFLCNVAVIIYSLLFLCTPFYTSRYQSLHTHILIIIITLILIKSKTEILMAILIITKQQVIIMTMKMTLIKVINNKTTPKITK